jgi:formylglycine-generating enzyme required for sulfatase activity/outer membrane protein assembly factor BamB
MTYNSTYNASSATGTFILTATFTDGPATAETELYITVLPTLTHLTASPASAEIYTNQSYNLYDIVLTAHYDDGSAIQIFEPDWIDEGGMTYNSTYNASSATGTFILTATFTDGPATAETELYITVNRFLSSLSLTPDNISIDPGQLYLLDDILVTASYSDGSIQNVACTNWTHNDSNGELIGAEYTAPALENISTTLTCTYTENEFTQNAVLTIGTGIFPDGFHKWTFEPTVLTFSSPAIYESDGTIYAGASNGNMYAINTDGTTKFTAMSSGQLTVPVIGNSGMIYFGSSNGTVSAFYSDGMNKWVYAAMGNVSNPAIDNNNSTLYVRDDYSLLAINVSNGSTKWSKMLSTGICPPTIGADGSVYIGTDDGNLQAFDEAGVKKWEVTLNGAIKKPVAIAADRTIYAVTDNGWLQALNSEGNIMWSLAFNTTISSVAIGFDETIYFGDGNNLFHALSPETGVEKWSFTADSPIGQAPTISENNVIYFQSNNGTLYAINENDGTKLWEQTGTGTATSPAIAADGTIYTGGDSIKAFLSYNGPLADTAWPRLSRDNHNTARMRYALDILYVDQKQKTIFMRPEEILNLEELIIQFYDNFYQTYNNVNIDSSWTLYSGSGNINNFLYTAPQTAGNAILEASYPHTNGVTYRAKLEIKTIEPGSLHNFNGIDFVWVPAGSFMMGSGETEVDYLADETPQHEVKISSSFWMSKNELTQEQWLAIYGSWPGYPSLIPDPAYGEGIGYPAYYISWNDLTTASTGFLELLNQQNPDCREDQWMAGERYQPVNVPTGCYRLPTEAEWEYAARAGSPTRFHYGDDSDYSELINYAWYNDPSGGSRPIGQKMPNAWGLYDMSGNVSEWVYDWYDAYYYTSATVENPEGAPSGTNKTVRGGNYQNYAADQRPAARSFAGPDSRNADIGARLIKTQNFIAPAVLAGINIPQAPESLFFGEILDLNTIEVFARYSDGQTALLDSYQINWSLSNGIGAIMENYYYNAPGYESTAILTVSYTEGDFTRSAEMHIQILFTGSTAWEFQADSDLFSKPAISPEEQYIYATDSQNLYVLDRSTGSSITTFWAGDTEGCGSPSVAGNGNVYFNCMSGMNRTIYSFAQGDYVNPLWSLEMGDSILNYLPIGSGNNVYFADNSYLYSLNGLSGTTEWKMELPSTTNNLSDISIDGDGVIYFGISYDGSSFLWAINPDGSLKWTIPLENGFMQAPLIIGADNIAYIQTETNHIYAINRHDGSTKWQYIPTDINYFYSPAVLNDKGELFLGAETTDTENVFIALSENGTEKWRKNITAAIYSSPAIGNNNYIYAISDGGGIFTVLVFEPENGDIVWSYEVVSSGVYYSSPAINISPDGKLLFSLDNKLYAVNTESTGMASSSWPTWGGNARNSGQPRQHLSLNVYDYNSNTEVPAHIVRMLPGEKLLLSDIWLEFINENTGSSTPVSPPCTWRILAGEGEINYASDSYSAPATAANVLLQTEHIINPGPDEVKYTSILPLQILEAGAAARFNGIDFVWIPAGKFNMGSAIDEEDRYADEGPVREVSITKGFWMSKFEVTQKQWLDIYGSWPGDPTYAPEIASGLGENYPAHYISWNDLTGTDGFLDKINAMNPDCYQAGWAGERYNPTNVPAGCYRLPTEAEWEYAARAGTQNRFYYGDDSGYYNLEYNAWYIANNTPTAGTKEVGYWMSNPWGLYDIHGNVDEWVWDYYSSDYSGLDTVDPVGAISGIGRVRRGGGFDNSGVSLRSANRSDTPVDSRMAALGARLVKTESFITQTGLLSLDLSYNTTTAYVSNTYNLYDLTATATYSDNTTAVISRYDISWAQEDGGEEYLMSGNDTFYSPTTPGEFAVIASYSQDGQTVTTRLIIEVSYFPGTTYADAGFTSLIPMAWIPSGNFNMGSPITDTSNQSDEQPQHEVHITSGFWMGQYEITQSQWETVMQTTVWPGTVPEIPDAAYGLGSDYPAYYISYEDVTKPDGFLDRLNMTDPDCDFERLSLYTEFDRYRADMVPLGCYRLPSEAEWEHAVRAGTNTRFHYGDDEFFSELTNYGWHNSNSTSANTVGMLEPNPWNLYDVYGNVFEMTADLYDASYYNSSPDTDPTGPFESDPQNPMYTQNVIRGGSWMVNVAELRSAARNAALMTERRNDLGFRVVKTIRRLTELHLSPVETSMLEGGILNLHDITLMAHYSDDMRFLNPEDVVWTVISGNGHISGLDLISTGSGEIKLRAAFTENGITRTADLIIDTVSAGTPGWSYTLNNPYSAPLTSPVLGNDNGLVYVSYGNRLDAIQRNGGWASTWFETGVDTDICSTPMISNSGQENESILYIACDSSLYAFDEHLIGNELKDDISEDYNWTYSMMDNGISVSNGFGMAIGNDQSVYFGVGSHFSAVQKDGSQKWSKVLTNLDITSTPIIDNNDHIYLGILDVQLSQYFLLNLDAADGSVKWQAPSTNIIAAPSAIGADGNIYTISEEDGNTVLYARNPITGDLLWAYYTNEYNTAAIKSPVIDKNGNIYISTTFHIHIINPSDGTAQKIIGDTITFGNIENSPIIGADGLLYLLNSEDKLYALNPETETLSWAISTGGRQFNSSPVIDREGRLYFVGVDNVEGYDFLQSIYTESIGGMSPSIWPKPGGNSRNNSRPRYQAILSPTLLSPKNNTQEYILNDYNVIDLYAVIDQDDTEPIYPAERTITDWILVSGSGNLTTNAGNEIYSAPSFDTDKNLALLKGSYLLNGETQLHAWLPVRPAGHESTFNDIIFVWIPPGSFTMGAADTDSDREAGESPQFEVTITEGFWMSKYEITQGQWETFHGTWPNGNPISSYGMGADYPAYNINWENIATSGGFLDSLNNLASGCSPGDRPTDNNRYHPYPPEPHNTFPKGCYRLPTEAEWEYAARSGTQTRFHYGDDLDYSQISNYAWYNITNTKPVGGKLPNYWNLYDMIGNVREWVWDIYVTYDSMSKINPVNDSGSTSRVLRGGWGYSTPSGNAKLRTTRRDSYGPTGTNDGVGFRIIRTDGGGGSSPLLINTN